MGETLTPSLQRGPRCNPEIGKPSYLVTSEVAVRLRCSIRTVHELTRRNAIPHRKMPGSRRCLFVESELNRWQDGETLEAIALEKGGRIVRPAYSGGTPLVYAGRRLPNPISPKPMKARANVRSLT